MPAIKAQAVQPEDAVRFFGSKVPVSSKVYKELNEQAKSRAFAVSGLARMDMVADLHTSLFKAIESGETLASRKKSIPKILEKTGWKGLRLETIFRTNVQTAYQAGRYAALQEVKELRPFWQYVAVGDQRTRANHAAMSGSVYPADHPFWDSYYPPNGFRCRCTVRSLSDRQLKNEGLAIQKNMPPLLPDQGFAGNPGKDWLQGLAPTELEGSKVRDLTKAAVCKGSGNFAEGDECRPPLASLEGRHILPIKKGDVLPKGLSEEAYALAFLKEFGLSRLNQRKIITLPGVRLPIVIDQKLMLDKATWQLKANKSGRGPYLKLLARTILDPYEIWQVPVEVSGRRTMSINLIRLFGDERRKIGGFGVFSLVGNKWQGSTIFNPKGEKASLMLQYLEEKRVGTLLYREK